MFCLQNDIFFPILKMLCDTQHASYKSEKDENRRSRDRKKVENKAILTVFSHKYYINNLMFMHYL